MDKKILYSFFDGYASKEEKEEIRSWLKDSEEHKKELFKEREFFDAVILSEKVCQDPKKEEAKRPLSKSILYESIKIAAVVALVLVCTCYFYQSKLKQASLATNIVTVPAGERAKVTLPDGTKVWLNACSEIQYPGIFIDSVRKVKLQGEAYFEVTHDKDHPFIVQTKKFNIKALGTKFDVDAYEDSNNFCTSLMQGSVEVSEQINPSSRIILKPGHQVSMTDGHLKETNTIKDYDLFRWREGLICFRDLTFEQLMIRFEKCYGIHIIVLNEKMKSYVCSGKFRVSDGINNALRIIQKDAKYKFERDENNTTIYIK